MKKYNKNIPFYIGILIILHHYKKHKNDKDLSTLDKFVQITDIDNHETWALFFLGIGIGMRLKSNNQVDNQLHTLLDNPVVDQLIDQMVNILDNQMVNLQNNQLVNLLNNQMVDQVVNLLDNLMVNSKS